MDLREKKQTSKGADRVQVDPPEGSRLDVVSPNWCDPCTWYEKATEVSGGTLTDSGDGLKFTSGDAWVDTEHGKLTGEDNLDPKYRAKVYDNGVEKTPDTPFGTPGDGDYSINYATGEVTFGAAPTGPVTADYYKTNGSEWTIKPAAGKVLRITEVEVQFSENIDLKDSVKFQLYVGGNPYGSPTVYKTMQDFINEASLAYPSIPQMGGSSGRGMAGPVRIFRWPYSERATTDLKSSLAMEIRISLASEAAFGGDVAVATFYGVSEAEA